MWQHENRASIERVVALIDRPSRTELRLRNEIRELLSIQIPIALSHIAVCRPITYLGTATGGAAFREVFDVVPFLQEIMKAHTNKNVQIHMVLKFVSPVPIRHFAYVPSSPYWMNVLGEYEFPPRCAMPMTNVFSPWETEGTACVYSVANSITASGRSECVLVPANTSAFSILPLYIIKYYMREG